MKDNFAKVKEFLNQNGIEYDVWTYGSRKGDVTCTAIHVTFYYDGIGNTREQRDIFQKKFNSDKYEFVNLFKKYFDGCRSTKLGIVHTFGGAMESYNIVNKEEYNKYKKLAEGEEAELEQFWKEYNKKQLATEDA